MVDSDPFDPTLLPRAAGLQNTGAICHFNSLLQGLGSCLPFLKAVTENPDYMSQTSTGEALYNYCRALQESAKTPEFLLDSRHSTQVLHALIGDLRKRRPKFQFGGGMESASEGLTLLLDMIEPPSEKAAAPEGCEGMACNVDPAATAGQQSNPIADVFMMRIRDTVLCTRCRAREGGKESQTDSRSEIQTAPGVVSVRADVTYQYQFFHYDEHDTVTSPIRTPEAFVKLFREHYTRVDDYRCEVCERLGLTVPEPGTIFRAYSLRLVPPVISMIFNQYYSHRQRYFPLKFRMKGKGGIWLYYRLTSQVEHSGSLVGGHYWAIALKHPAPSSTTPIIEASRVEPTIYNCNDLICRPSHLGGTPHTYTVFYCFDHQSAE